MEPFELVIFERVSEEHARNRRGTRGSRSFKVLESLVACKCARRKTEWTRVAERDLGRRTVGGQGPGEENSGSGRDPEKRRVGGAGTRRGEQWEGQGPEHMVLSVVDH